MPCEFCASSDLEKYFEYQGQDYICSKPDDSGMHSCSNLPLLKIGKFHKYSIYPTFIIHLFIYLHVNPPLLCFLYSQSLFQYFLLRYFSFFISDLLFFRQKHSSILSLLSCIQYSFKIFVIIVWCILSVEIILLVLILKVAYYYISSNKCVLKIYSFSFSFIVVVCSIIVEINFTHSVQLITHII